MLKMLWRIWTIRDYVENESSLKCQRDAKTNTGISNELVESDIEALVARFLHPVDTDPDHETVVIQEVDHAVAVHVVAEMMVAEHFMTNQPIRSTGPHRRQNGVLRSIIFLHAAAGKTWKILCARLVKYVMELPMEMLVKTRVLFATIEKRMLKELLMNLTAAISMVEQLRWSLLFGMIGKQEALVDHDRDHQDDHVVHHRDDPDHEVDQDQVAKTLEAAQDRDLALQRNLDDHEAAQDQTLDEFSEDSDALDEKFRKTVIFLYLARSIL